MMLRRTYRDNILTAGMFLFYWLLVVQLPDKVPVPQLDPSWASALSYFAAGRWQFGSEIVFTFGPLGFINPHYYTGYWLTPTIVIELLVKAAVAYQLLLVTQRAGKRWGLLFFLLTLLFSHPIKDYLFHFAITFALILIIESLHQPRRLLGWTVFLAVLSLIKFSFLVMSLAGLVSVGIYGAIDRNWKSLVALAGIYAASLLVIWAVAGQNPSGLYAYLISGWQIAAGYQKSMFHSSDTGPLFVGLAMLTGSALVLIGLWGCGKKDWRTLAIAVIAAQGIFLSWKHGFVRAEFFHIIQFYFFVPLVLLSAWAVLKSSLRTFQRPLASVLTVTLALPYAGMILGGPPYWVVMLRPPGWAQIVDNPRAMADFSAYRATMDRRLQANKEKFALPNIEALVGRESIDVFGFEQGIALLNHFNYRPRPVFQSYSAYNHFLIEANRRFYLSDRAPLYVLVKLQSIDNRLAVADDSSTLAVILLNYTPIVAERGYLLMRRRPGPATDIELRLVEDRTAQLNQKVELPRSGQRLWVALDWELTWRQKLREFVYQPDEVEIELTTEQGTRQVYRLTQSLASAGFMISPWCDDTFDLLESLTEKSTRSVKTFQLKSSATNPQPRYRYKIYTIPDFAPSAPPSGDTLHQLRYWTFDRAPTRVQASPSAKIIDIGDRSVFLAPAPSEIAFEVPHNAAVLEGYLGVQFTPFQRGADVDEANFIVEFVDRNQTPMVLFHRRLRPDLDASHRDRQPFRITLPQNVHGQIRLRATIPGPTDDLRNRTYWSDVRFK